jgi:hypothetical protein
MERFSFDNNRRRPRVVPACETFAFFTPHGGRTERLSCRLSLTIRDVAIWHSCLFRCVRLLVVRALTSHAAFCAVRKQTKQGLDVCCSNCAFFVRFAGRNDFLSQRL